MNEKTFTFVPLSPSQVYEDKLKLKKKSEVKSSKEPYENARKSKNNGRTKRKD